MRLSEFHRAVADEFGGTFGSALVRDLVLGELGDLTAAQALKSGIPARTVWLALCRENDVPEARRHGVGLADPR